MPVNPCPLARPAGTANKDVEAFWQQARQDAGVVVALVGADARRSNKAQGTGSTAAASLGDREQFSLAQAQSAYKGDMCAGHVRVGKRGVSQSPAAMQAVSSAAGDAPLVQAGCMITALCVRCRPVLSQRCMPCACWQAQHCVMHTTTLHGHATWRPLVLVQYEESRKQAEQNKKVGKRTNMKLALF